MGHSESEDRQIEKIKESSKCIKLTPERQKESEEFKQAQKLMHDAERIFFLGFGYDMTNCERLCGADFPLLEYKGKEITGTGHDLTVAEMDGITVQLGGFSKYIRVLV